MTTKPGLFGEINLGTGPALRPARAVEKSPFRMLILGDFSGRQSRGVARSPGDPLRPIPIDRDEFETVFRRLGVEIAMTIGDSGRATVSFGEFDELHPDHIVDRLDVFAELRALRRRLLSPAGFDAAAAEMAGWADAPAAEPETPAPAPTAGEPISTDDLLSAVLAESTEAAADVRSRSGSDLADRLIAEIVAPHVLPAPDPRRDDLVAAVDAATAHQLRAILHHPGFQAVEAAWRGLDMLVRRSETDTTLKLYLIDIGKAELAAQFETDDLARTPLYKLLVEQALETPGGLPWAAILCATDFAATEAEAGLLGRLAMVAARAGAPFLAGADPLLAGCRSFAATPDPDDWTDEPDGVAAEAWAALRALPEASSVGLFSPRFLLRLPYGARTTPIEAFPFEELPDGEGAAPRHDAFLWGNPAFAAACLLGQAFTAEGWAMHPGRPNELEDMPLYLDPTGDGSETLPCAEILLTERGAQKLLAHGLTPVWSVRNQDRIRVGPFRSLAGGDLAGTWSRS